MMGLLSYIMYVTSALVITNANDIDTGNYTCMADNGIVAVDNNRVEVFVRGV